MEKHIQFSHIIDGEYVGGATGADVLSIDPFTGQILWSSFEADEAQIVRALETARIAQANWSRTPLEVRVACATRFTEIVTSNSTRLANLIAKEAGKPLWEAKVEANSLVTKLSASVESYRLRCSEFGKEVRGIQSKTRFLPHGVMAVIGPYNFPASMANSHIMPALIAGNAVVFKPSELTPQTGLAVAEMWQQAGIPKGVLSCLTGGPRVGSILVNHRLVDGVLFVGSHRAGISILQALATCPEKIVALEMGGNNPLVIYDYDESKIKEVVALIIQSSMLSSGQRCTAARRLLLPKDDTIILPQLIDALRNTKIGHYSETPEPYYGPMIRKEAVERAVARFDQIGEKGGKVWLEPQISGPIKSVLSPGVIEIPNLEMDTDEEIFGPILKVIRFKGIDEAIDISNQTKFGLSAGIVSRRFEDFSEYHWRVKAGIVNWNQQLTGATTFAPFGGAKQSGNNRPAGFLAADYCSYAVASFEVPFENMALANSPGLPF